MLDGPETSPPRTTNGQSQVGVWTTAHHRLSEEDHEIRVSAGVVTGGSTLAAVTAAVAIVLAIIGLAWLWPVQLAAVTTIVLGAGMLIDSGALAARWAPMTRTLGSRTDVTEMIGGVTLSMLAGSAAVVLGIIALAKVSPGGLLSISMLVLGGALVIEGAAWPQVDRLVPARPGGLLGLAMRVAGGAMAVTGLAAAVLGILGIIGAGDAVVLALAASLCVAVGLGAGATVAAARFGRQLVAEDRQ